MDKITNMRKERQIDRHVDSQGDKWLARLIDRQTHAKIDIQTLIKTGRKIDRQMTIAYV